MSRNAEFGHWKKVTQLRSVKWNSWDCTTLYSNASNICIINISSPKNSTSWIKPEDQNRRFQSIKTSKLHVRKTRLIPQWRLSKNIAQTEQKTSSTQRKLGVWFPEKLFHTHTESRTSLDTWETFTALVCPQFKLNEIRLRKRDLFNPGNAC